MFILLTHLSSIKNVNKEIVGESIHTILETLKWQSISHPVGMIRLTKEKRTRDRITYFFFLLKIL